MKFWKYAILHKFRDKLGIFVYYSLTVVVNTQHIFAKMDEFEIVASKYVPIPISKALIYLFINNNSE